MAGSINKVILIGNLGRDPEIRYSQSGNKIANFSIATSENWKDKQTGERREKTEWHRIVIFNEGLANIVEKYIKKGSKVYIEGALQTRKWTGPDGADKYTTEIVLQGFNSTLTMLDNRGDSVNSGGSENSLSQPDWAGSEADVLENVSASGDLDDEIPF